MESSFGSRSLQTFWPFSLHVCSTLKADMNVIEQQDCSMLDWTSAANGALLLRPEAPSGVLRLDPPAGH